MAIHGASDRSAGKEAGRVKTKGASTYNGMLADIKDAGEDEAALCGVMMSRFKITHGIDMFWAGQEPLAGKYELLFCGIDLAEITIQMSTATSAIKRAASLRDWIFPLNLPCEYQFWGHGDQVFESVPCGKTLTTIKEQGDHMRSQVRTMQNKGANGDKVPTCFLGACVRDPEGGRIHREGLDFDSVDDMRDHV
ncbi:hypothetical protein CFAM422_008353 [Trichoderma lentiforme]|uniref:Uncharacterized protein n=1 Tax=Trichoderma lentiforme TaxID=1567552 RepID=A0A9P4XBL8_9HYPO|nr:hypothetical protein CFAM422_008353 [Trichoderma lentiforme]